MTPVEHVGAPLRLVPSDAEQLAWLMRTCFLQAYAHASTPARVAAYLDRVYAPARIARELEDSSLPTWAWQTSDGVRWAGFGRLQLPSPFMPGLGHPGVVELQRFYLHADFHGCGVAAPFLHHLMQAAAQAGGTRMQLSVWKEAPQALRFYIKQGFRIAGSTIFWIEDDPKDDWIMLRDLDAIPS